MVRFMELSAELFEKTLQELKGDGGVGGVERRNSPRVGMRCRVKLLPIVDGRVGPPLEAWTRDISRSGIGIMCPMRLKTNTHYVVSLAHQKDADKEHLVLYCTVRNCEELVRGIYVVGFSFEALRAREGAAVHPGQTAAQATPASATPAPVMDKGATDEVSRIRNAILA